ncbi:MAG: Alkaline elastase YaB [Flavobacterium sp. SCGC AAA160-P02]|nr:MAG: Alkaline elastase YaB [Flavobacterium sp. SCGC AAA160-P02]
MKINFTLLHLIIFAFFFAVDTSFSQKTKPILFQEKEFEMPNNIKQFDWSQLRKLTNSSTEGFYLVVQFEKTPNQEIQNEFISRGIGLRDYVSNHSYFLYTQQEVDIEFLESSGVVSIMPIPLEFKISSKIRNNEIGTWAIDGDNILVNLVFHQSILVNKVLSDLNIVPGISVLEQYKKANLMTLSIPSDKIEQVAMIPSVKWIELIQEPSVKEDFKGKSIHRSSNLDTQTTSGRNYTGMGIGVIVRDDGIVGPHIDFQGRIDNTAASGTGSTHGDGVAGILAGAGNLDPTKRGMAAGSDVYVTNYSSSFQDTATTNLLDNGDAQITNSSYGNGCNDGYTSISRTVDLQTNTNTSVLHVFSTGNSGTTNCGYGAGSNWGNITGGHKQGKNVIATANVYYDGVLASSSSRGPATDGRIKPDITAHGQGQLSTDENNGYFSFGGTSGAAPGIAGVSAQLYQLYKDQNEGQLPESALIKAALLNTANDYGNVGPDFKFGWGVVNGLRAAMLLEDERFLEDTITQDSENNHTISIPADTKQVRFMLYWNDPAAVAGASTALVNDIDLKVISPTGSELFPWILDPSPNPVTLDQPATNGADHLNNMEQVLINNPQAGDYTLNIKGYDIPSGPQHYFVLYEIISEELTLTYPIGNEKFVVGEQEVIHWDAINTSGNFSLEYSTDNGNSWSSIGTASSTSTNYTWTVPNTVSGESIVRITSGSFSDQSSATFSIANQVSGVDISQICPENLTIVWDLLTDATSYDVYILGEKFMEKVGTTSETSLSIEITDPDRPFWVAVSATGGNNWETRRSIAINNPGGLYNCSLSKDITVESITNDFSSLDLICSGDNSIDISANIRNLGTESQSNFSLFYQLDSNVIVEETYTGTLNPGTQDVYTFSTPLTLTQDGTHSLKVWVSLPGDEFVANDEYEETFYTQILLKPINEVETFEVNGFPPVGWVVENPDDAYPWSPATITGIDGQSTTAAYINNYSYNASGQEDIFATLVYDLTGTNMVLSFDLAKAQYSASYSDGLKVDISTDCGVSYTNIYDKEGLDLSTLDGYNTTQNWTPSSGSDWKTETVDLSAYSNQKVKIRFVNVNGYGNSTYIDNIVITGTLSNDTEDFDDHFVLFPNPVEDRFTIRSKKVALQKVCIYNLLGREVLTIKTDDNQEIIQLNTGILSSGVYLVRLESELGVFYKKILKK